MYQVKPTDDLYDITKPCDYFDMMCATSTGGSVSTSSWFVAREASADSDSLIAIMLGRLHMDVQETIDAYISLASDVFQEKTYAAIYPNWMGSVVGKPRFSGEKLAEAIKTIVERVTGSKETSMHDARESACKVQVLSLAFPLTLNNVSFLIDLYAQRELQTPNPLFYEHTEVMKRTAAGEPFGKRPEPLPPHQPSFHQSSLAVLQPNMWMVQCCTTIPYAY